MQLIENKRPIPFLIAEISAIRKFAPHFLTRRFRVRSVIPSRAKPACHLPAARRTGRHIASAFPAPPSPPFRALWTRPASGDRTVTALAKGGVSSIPSRQAARKLEFRLNAFASATSKFLIDNFKRLLPALRSHSSIAIGQHANSPGAPSFGTRAKGGVFPIANRHAHRKLEFRLSVLSSASFKFLIDKFRRDLAFAPANCPNEGPA